MAMATEYDLWRRVVWRCTGASMMWLVGGAAGQPGCLDQARVQFKRSLHVYSGPRNVSSMDRVGDVVVSGAVGDVEATEPRGGAQTRVQYVSPRRMLSRPQNRGENKIIDSASEHNIGISASRYNIVDRTPDGQHQRPYIRHGISPCHIGYLRRYMSHLGPCHRQTRVTAVPPTLPRSDATHPIPSRHRCRQPSRHVTLPECLAAPTLWKPSTLPPPPQKRTIDNGTRRMRILIECQIAYAIMVHQVYHYAFNNR